jgi:chloramphenicol 3-O-phosphotransferase
MPSDHISSSSSAPMADSTSSNSTAAPTAAAVPQHRHIWIITGPAGCGKTSVAEYLSTAFALPYLEGDSVSSVQFPSPQATVLLTLSTSAVPPTSQH